MQKNFKAYCLAISTIFIFGCSQTETVEKMEQQTEPSLVTKITPAKMASELKSEYKTYNDIIETLEEKFPEKEILLTEMEKKKIFPEQMIGESFTCRGTKSAFFHKKDFLVNKSKEGGYYENQEISYDLSDTNDKLAIKINADGTINFNTSTAVEYGTTEPQVWKIITNNMFFIIAQDIWGSDKNNIQTLSIDKETGFGIWQESNLNGPPVGYPTGQMIYLNCFIPETKIKNPQSED